LKRINLNMRRILTPATITFVLLFIGMKFVPVGIKQRNSTSVGALARVPDLADPRVSAVLDRSCRDCHSDHTRWPWYSRAAPVSWVLYRDVSKGQALEVTSAFSGKNSTLAVQVTVYLVRLALLSARPPASAGQAIVSAVCSMQAFAAHDGSQNSSCS
jgi:hypothetical protein